MRAMGLPKSRYITEPRRISKDGLMGILEGMPEEHKIAWVTTDARSFEWSEINGRREGFLEDMRGTDFREAYMCVLIPGRDNVKYMSFRIAS